MRPLLITVSSWEDRFDLGFKRIVESIPNQSVEPLVFTFKDHHYDEKVPHIKSAQAVVNFNDVLFSLDKFNEAWSGIKKQLGNLSSEKKVLLDISTMPRHITWTILRFLEEIRSKDVTCIYHQPAEYDSNWITKNPGVPQIVYKLGGEMEIGVKTSLFILAGYDQQRIYNLINWYDPDKVLLGIHKNDSMFCERTIDKTKLADTKVLIEQFEYNALESDFGFAEIQKKHRSFFESDRNILLASLGPKSSAIPLYKINREYSNTALVYIPSQDYNPNYSRGIGEQYMCSLSFSCPDV